MSIFWIGLMNTQPKLSFADSDKKVQSDEFETKVVAAPLSPLTSRSSSTGTVADASSSNANSSRLNRRQDLAQLGPLDCLCGRGRIARNIAGNVRFNEEIEKHLDSYVALSSKQDKSRFIHNVTRYLCNDIGFRFVKKPTGRRAPRRMSYPGVTAAAAATTDTPFVELDEREIYEKVGHALRDIAVKRYGTASSKRKRQREEGKTNSRTGVAQRLQQQKTPTYQNESNNNESNEYMRSFQRNVDNLVSPIMTGINSINPATNVGMAANPSSPGGSILDNLTRRHLLSQHNHNEAVDLLEPLPVSWGIPNEEDKEEVVDDTIFDPE